MEFWYNLKVSITIISIVNYLQYDEWDDVLNFSHFVFIMYYEFTSS